MIIAKHCGAETAKKSMLVIISNSRRQHLRADTTMNIQHAHNGTLKPYWDQAALILKSTAIEERKKGM